LRKITKVSEIFLNVRRLSERFAKFSKKID